MTLFKAKTKYKIIPPTDSSCEQFDPEIQGGFWNCDSYDEFGHCDLSCFTGQQTFSQSLRFKLGTSGIHELKIVSPINSSLVLIDSFVDF